MRYTFFILFYFLGLLPVNSGAIDQTNTFSNITIIHKDSVLKTNEGYIFGIMVDLKEGWKTYWKNPGDSGSKPTLTSENMQKIKTLKILYPTPNSFMDSGIQTIGYENQVIFPVLIKFGKGIESITERLKFTYLICEKICIPVEKDFILNININEISATTNSRLRSTFENLPVLNDLNFSIKKVNNTSETSYDVYFEKKKNANLKDIFLYVPDKKFEYLIKQTSNSLVAKINFYEKVLKDEIKIEFIINSGEVSEKKISTLKVPNSNYQNSFGYIILLAFLGGIILNFMPCVLPILSLKIYSLVDLSRNKDNNNPNILCASVILGIVFSFLLLATVTIILKLIGHQIGWGIQFQSRNFIFFFALILFFFGLNLLGFFELFLPKQVTNFLNVKSNNIYLNNFFTGMVSTFLATPCSAPFLGTAVGYAFSQGVFDIYIIFLSLAIGFSFPYFLPIFFKNSFKLIPKPGQWMNTFKIFLGLIVLISSAWFFSLLNIERIYLWSTLIIVISALMIIVKKSKSSLSIVLTFFIFINIYFIKTLYSNSNEEIWKKFDETKLNSLINSERTIFIDITADWCVTCQFNKITTLDSKSMLEYFEEKNVYLLRADWTNKDKKILNFMKKFGRYGIPINIIYGPNNKEGIILSEILTENQITKNIEMANQK